MKDLNPYVEARREWNDRHLVWVQAFRVWQISAVAEMALAGVLGGGLVALSLQHKTVPYVVEVDALGAATAVKPAETAGRPTDERIVRYQLAAFIRGTRGVMTDRVAMKRGLDQVYAYARGSARAFLDDHYRANNPFEIAKTYTVLPAVTSLLQLSERSWQVRWNEEQRGLDGTLLTDIEDAFSSRLTHAMAGMDRVFRERYPGYRPATDWPAAYDQWTRTTLDTLRGTLAAARLHAEDFADEQRRIQTLTALRDSAEGRTQGAQAGHMPA